MESGKTERLQLAESGCCPGPANGPNGPNGRVRVQVFFDTVIVGNFEEKSFALAAILIAVRRAISR